MKDKQVEDAQRFFKVLFRGLDEANRIEIRLQRPGSRESEGRGFGDDIDAAIECAMQASSERGLEAYFGVAARGPLWLGKKHNLTYIATAFADMDVGKFWESKQQALAALDSFDTPPSAVVDSGGGLHAYWFLTEPVFFGEAYSLWRCREKCFDCQQKRSGRCKACRDCSAEKNPTHIPAEMDRIEGVMRGLVELLRLDKGVWDATRILRVPGTANHKPGRPVRPVQLLYLHLDRRYDVDELVERYYRPCLDEEDEPTRRFFPAAVTNAKKAWARLKRDATKCLTPGELRSLTTAVETGDAQRFTKSDGSPGDRSGRDKSAAKKLLRCGADQGDILAIWQRFSIGDKFRESRNGKRYLRSVILAAERSLEKDATTTDTVEPTAATRHIDYNWWFWWQAYPKVRRVLRALPGTYEAVVTATEWSLPTVRKWLRLCADVGWVTVKKVTGTGGAPSKMFERTEDAPASTSPNRWGTTKTLYRASATRALFASTNKTAKL